MLLLHSRLPSSLGGGALVGSEGGNAAAQRFGVAGTEKHRILGAHASGAAHIALFALLVRHLLACDKLDEVAPDTHLVDTDM